MEEPLRPMGRWDESRGWTGWSGDRSHSRDHAEFSWMRRADWPKDRFDHFHHRGESVPSGRWHGRSQQMSDESDSS